MASESDLVALDRFSSPAIAQLVADLLREAGIPVYVGGSLLQDEWAISQKLMGLLDTEVQVPRDRLEEAREIIASVRNSGEGVGEDDEEDGGDSSGE